MGSCMNQRKPMPWVQNTQQRQPQQLGGSNMMRGPDCPGGCSVIPEDTPPVDVQYRRNVSYNSPHPGPSGMPAPTSYSSYDSYESFSPPCVPQLPNFSPVAGKGKAIPGKMLAKKGHLMMQHPQLTSTPKRGASAGETIAPCQVPQIFVTGPDTPESARSQKLYSPVGRKHQAHAGMGLRPPSRSALPNRETKVCGDTIYNQFLSPCMAMYEKSNRDEEEEESIAHENLINNLFSASEDDLPEPPQERYRNDEDQESESEPRLRFKSSSVKNREVITQFTYQPL